MKTFCLLLVAALIPLKFLHAEVTIFDVRKNLPLSDHDKVYHDYYLNGGTESGLSPGMILTVERRLPLYDTYQNHAAGDLQLKVAKIKIIHAQKGLAVARLYAEFSREDAPLLEDNFIMVGDSVDLSSATTEGKKTAENSAAPSGAPAPQGVASAQIFVNSVDLSSHAPAAPTAATAAVPPSPKPMQGPVNTPSLQ